MSVRISRPGEPISTFRNYGSAPVKLSATAPYRKQSSIGALFVDVFKPSEADEARAMNMTGGKVFAARSLLKEWEQLGILEGQS